MKASTFSDAQKAFILMQGADGMPVDVYREGCAGSRREQLVADSVFGHEMLRDEIRRQVCRPL